MKPGGLGLEERALSQSVGDWTGSGSSVGVLSRMVGDGASSHGWAAGGSVSGMGAVWYERSGGSAYFAVCGVDGRNGGGGAVARAATWVPAMLAATTWFLRFARVRRRSNTSPAVKKFMIHRSGP